VGRSGERREPARARRGRIAPHREQYRRPGYEQRPVGQCFHGERGERAWPGHAGTQEAEKARRIAASARRRDRRGGVTVGIDHDRLPQCERSTRREHAQPHRADRHICGDQGERRHVVTQRKEHGYTLAVTLPRGKGGGTP